MIAVKTDLHYSVQHVCCIFKLSAVTEVFYRYYALTIFQIYYSLTPKNALQHTEHHQQKCMKRIIKKKPTLQNIKIFSNVAHALWNYQHYDEVIRMNMQQCHYSGKQTATSGHWQSPAMLCSTRVFSRHHIARSESILPAVDQQAAMAAFDHRLHYLLSSSLTFKTNFWGFRLSLTGVSFTAWQIKYHQELR